MRDGTVPRMTVIVPVRDGAVVLDASLSALCASDLPRQLWELIVVDDGSVDHTVEVAARFADAVIRLEGPAHGPAFARNAGAEAACGEVLVFVDADVVIHADVLRGFLGVLASHPSVAAVFGAYDRAPRASGLISQYRNLLHHYEHARQAGEAHTFWAGCGAVRRSAFTAAGGFDARRYPRPQIEDIALGYRLSSLGYRILLRPSLQCTHLKRWTLRSMVLTDLRDRGIPWMRLLLSQSTGKDGGLNVRPSERFLTALTMLSVVAVVTAPVIGVSMLAVAGTCLLLVLLGNAPLLAWFSRVRTVGFAVAVIPLRLLHYLINTLAVAIAAWHELGSRADRRSGSVSTAPPGERSLLAERSDGDAP